MPFGLAFLAGAIGTLSPCVLPVLPIIMGSTRQAGKFGPMVLALGLIVSFTGVGYFVSSIGFRMGITQERVSLISAFIMLLAGLFLYFDALQRLLSGVLGRFSNSLSTLAPSQKSNYKSQFFTGMLLGGIWSPCTGPTLGIAISLAASQERAHEALSLMAVYGLGSAMPLMLAAYGSKFLSERRSKIADATQKTKKFFAIILIVIGIIMLTRADKFIEGLLLGILPDSFVDFITKY